MLIFGINQKTAERRLEEETPFPILRVREREKEKTSYRISFDSSAVELMGSQETPDPAHTWTIGQLTEENGKAINFLISLDKLPPGVVPDFSFQLCKNGNLNNQKFWKHLRKLYNQPTGEFTLMLDREMVQDLDVLVLRQLNLMTNDVKAQLEVELTADEIQEEEFLEPDEEFVDSNAESPNPLF